MSSLKGNQLLVVKMPLRFTKLLVKKEEGSTYIGDRETSSWVMCGQKFTNFLGDGWTVPCPEILPTKLSADSGR
jgi:hypothetical protein